MRISDWSSDVCSSDLRQCAEDGVKKARKVWIPLSLVIIFAATKADGGRPGRWIDVNEASVNLPARRTVAECFDCLGERRIRSEEHTSELQSLMRISYAVFCLKTKIQKTKITYILTTYIDRPHLYSSK